MPFQQISPVTTSPLQESIPTPLPSIILHDCSTHTQVDDHSTFFQQPTDDDLDPMATDDPAAYDYSDSSIHDNSELSAHDYTDQSVSGISAHFPPSSGMPSEVSSAVTSDSDLPPLPSPAPFKSSKPAKQTGLLNFFPTVSAGEVHAAWGKRKRENQERDEKERAEVMRQEEEWKQEKLSDVRERNRLSQQKRRKRIHGQEMKTGIRNEDGKKSQVS